MHTHTKDEICGKIVSLYPEIGACGIDIDVDMDDEKHAWVVHLRKSGHQLTHYLEMSDAEACIDGKQCVSLGLDIAQLKNNIEGKQF